MLEVKIVEVETRSNASTCVSGARLDKVPLVSMLKNYIISIWCRDDKLLFTIKIKRKIFFR